MSKLHFGHSHHHCHLVTLSSFIQVMALPIPIVVDNFADYYSEQKKIEAKELKKEAQAKQAEFDVDAEKV